jgi:hypothetical protein
MFLVFFNFSGLLKVLKYSGFFFLSNETHPFMKEMFRDAGIPENPPCTAWSAGQP